MINIEEKNPFKQIKIKLNIHPEPYARPRLGRNHIFYNPRDKYKRKLIKLVKSTINENNFKIINGEVILKLTFGITAPKNIINSKTKLNLIKDDILHPITRPDLDNYIKPVLDSLNKVVFADDGQICHLIGKKVYVEKEEDEFILIQIKYRQEPIKLR